MLRGVPIFRLCKVPVLVNRFSNKNHCSLTDNNYRNLPLIISQKCKSYLHPLLRQ